MIRLRAEKVARIVADIPPLDVNGDNRGDLLMVGWGGTLGAIQTAVAEVRSDGLNVSSIHLRHLNPFPSNLGEILQRFDKILVPELNQGQLVNLLRAEFLVAAQGMGKVRGQPFAVTEIVDAIRTALGEES
jgi:2-oxoglutarate ferredoxin oxidoreductase subunit alpha